jgi:hypothetical protein
MFLVFIALFLGGPQVAFGQYTYRTVRPYGGMPAMPSPPVRYHFTIAGFTPLRELLPAPPRTELPDGPVTGDDLSKVPEVTFEAAGGRKREEATRHTALTIARINSLKEVRTDGFLKALVAERRDLAGLPFVLGEACRTTKEDSLPFTDAVRIVRRALSPADPSLAKGKGFWERFKEECWWHDIRVTVRSYPRAAVTAARVRALMQVLAAEPTDVRLGLARHLAGVQHVEATKALARLVLFSPEKEVRAAAVEALKSRPAPDYTEALLAGLRYPMPAVASRTAEAVVTLKRTDLVPRLVELLDEPSPLAPRREEVNGKRALVVREVVRINHHRNCLLCHAPGNTARIPAEVTRGPVPNPHDELRSGPQYYKFHRVPAMLVRADVTYLRQDFSALLPVKNAKPWPEMQRFDFVVRRRALSEAQTATYRANLAKVEGRGPPHRRAVLSALRGLTGKDAGPTAGAWRRLPRPAPLNKAATPVRSLVGEPGPGHSTARKEGLPW